MPFLKFKIRKISKVLSTESILKVKQPRNVKCFISTLNKPEKGNNVTRLLAPLCMHLPRIGSSPSCLRGAGERCVGRKRWQRKQQQHRLLPLRGRESTAAESKHSVPPTAAALGPTRPRAAGEGRRLQSFLLENRELRFRMNTLLSPVCLLSMQFSLLHLLFDFLKFVWCSVLPASHSLSRWVADVRVCVLI